MICCHQFVHDYLRREKDLVFVTNLGSIILEGKKYDLVSPIGRRLI